MTLIVVAAAYPMQGKSVMTTNDMDEAMTFVREAAEHSAVEIIIRFPDQEPSLPPVTFTCPHCNRTSYNPNDLAHRYCGNCKHFCDEVS